MIFHDMFDMTELTDEESVQFCNVSFSLNAVLLSLFASFLQPVSSIDRFVKYRYGGYELMRYCPRLN
jgi:hypothetical protein